MRLSVSALYRTHQRTLLSVAGLLFLYLVLSVIRHDRSRNHYLTPDLITHSVNVAESTNDLPTPAEATEVCHKNGFPAYQSSSSQRKIYDLILLSTELDWLEIRLHTLAPFVDYFVVVESTLTFSGYPKPLYLQENWDAFAPFHHKIIHRVVPDTVSSERVWDHEDFFRNSLLLGVFPSLVGTEQEAHDGDVLVVSDIDEIVRPGAMLILRNCDIPPRLTLATDFYYYSFQWRHRGPQWPHPDVTVFRGIERTIPPNDLRHNLLDAGWPLAAAYRRWRSRATLWNAGWHCSSCFATVAEMRLKMQSFSHTSYNTETNRDAQVMMDRVRNGLDLFGRASEIFDRVPDNQDVPTYILQQFRERGRFKYLLDRDGEDAGFEDLEIV